MPPYKYKFKIKDFLEENFEDKDVILAYAQESGLSPLLTKLLIMRGFRSLKLVKKYLHPGTEYFYSHLLLKDMQKALSRIEDSIQKNELITIVGHDDMDGITATVVLFKALHYKGAKVDYYIPDREIEGHGLSEEIITKLLCRGTKLLITVDNGISAFKEIEYALKSGIDTIVTDHHELPERLPPAVACISPKVSPYPFNNLAGVGVALKLALGTLENCLERKNKMLLDRLIGLCAFGTISDYMPLEDENRQLVYEGLKSFQRNQDLGLAVLLEELGIESLNTVKELSSRIIPLFYSIKSENGVHPGVELFLANDKHKAFYYYSLLKENYYKQSQVNLRQLQYLSEKISNLDLRGRKYIFISDDFLEIKPLGYCASKFSQKFRIPVILIGKKDQIYGVAEARTVNKKVNLVDLFKENKDLFVKYGGHKNAAGFTVMLKNMRELEKRFEAKFSTMKIPSQEDMTIEIDFELNLDQVTCSKFHGLYLFNPFGASNSPPLCLHNAQLSNLAIFKENESLFLNSERIPVSFVPQDLIEEFNKRIIPVNTKILYYVNSASKDKLNIEIVGIFY